MLRQVRDYFYLSWGAIWERKGRTIGSIVGIVISVLALGTALGIGNGFYTMFVKTFASTFGVNTIYVIPQRGTYLTDVDIILLSRLPYVEMVAPVVFTTGIIDVGGKPRVIYIVGASSKTLPRLLGATSLNSVILEGKPVLAPGTALVGFYVAFSPTTLTQHIYPGQRVIVQLPGGRYLELTVSGILKPTQITPYGNPNIAVFVDYKTFFTLVQRKRTYNLAIVYVSKTSKINFVENLIKKYFPQFEVFSPEIAIRTFEQFVFALETFLTVLASVGILIVGLWMFDTMTISVVQRTREIGILKAIGFTRRQVFTMILIEAVVVSLIGIAIGILLLLPLSGAPLLPLGPAFAIRVLLTPEIVAMVALTPLIANIIATIIPAYRAARITPLEALRAE